MKLNSLALVFVLFSTFAVAQAQTFSWKGIFIAGDDSIENFDNGRIDLSDLMTKLTKMDTIQLTSSRNHVSKTVFPATAQNIKAAFTQTPVGKNEGCFVHMTSHGIKNQGFYLSLGGVLSPRDLASYVNTACGNAPTIILVSACYSGQFINENMKGPNRIIMTAAIHNRPSFGCSPDTRYTYWDQCLLDSIPVAKTWTEVYKKVQACIQVKESSQGFPSSYPQAYFGANTVNWTVSP